MKSEDLKPNKVFRGPLSPEPVQLIFAIPMGSAVKLAGKGLNPSIRICEDQQPAVSTKF